MQPKQHLYDSGLGNRREKAGSLSAPQLKMVEPEAADSYNGCLRGTLTKRKKLSQEDTVQVPTSSCAQSQTPSTTAGNWTSIACFRQSHCTSYL